MWKLYNEKALTVFIGRICKVGASARNKLSHWDVNKKFRALPLVLVSIEQLSPSLCTFYRPLNLKELHKSSVNDKLSQIFAPFEDKECRILLIPPKLFLFCLTSL